MPLESTSSMSSKPSRPAETQNRTGMVAKPRVEPAAGKAGDAPASGSAERTLRLMSLLAEQGRPLTLAELTVQLQLPKVTVHRLCANLVVGGFLARDIDERSFTVGPALRELAFNALNHATLRGLRHAVLKELVGEIGETCNFTTLDGAEVLYLDRVEARRPLRLTIDVGAHVPLHCSASGKLLLAHMPKRQRDTVIRHLPMPALTPSTLTLPEALRAECDEILQAGFARDREEFVIGLIAVAVPVRAKNHAVRATISVHAPVARLSMQDAEARLGALLLAAEAMSRLI